MAKKSYRSPMLLALNPDNDPTIVIGSSQGTSGYDSQFSFDVDSATKALIDANCDDIDIADMDTNHDRVITQSEYDAWYAENGWF